MYTLEIQLKGSMYHMNGDNITDLIRDGVEFARLFDEEPKLEVLDSRGEVLYSVEYLYSHKPPVP